MSIYSYPDRGKWGKSSWRGNCTGHMYVDLFNQFKPKTFIDPMMGSGTSIEVAEEMGIEAYGLDLHQGFNILRDSILEKVGKEVDLCLSHPPYGALLTYSGSVWGSEPHPDDLSHCIDTEDFNRKLQVALLNQRNATLPGGLYGTIIGDHRQNGAYHCFMAEAIARMPQGELKSVLIKAQHNTTSARQSYGKMRMPFITHEYVIIWERSKVIMGSLLTLALLAKEQAARLAGTWSSIVRHAMIELGGAASLTDLYEKVAKSAPDKLSGNDNWKAKIRQTLQLNSAFTSEERGNWKLA